MVSVDIKKLLIAAFNLSESKADDLAPAIESACERYEINTPLRVGMFLAQTSYESQGFTRFEENLKYSAKRLRQVFSKYFRTYAEAEAFAYKPYDIANRVYGGRLGNGAEETGDGYKHRGMGPIQLTGKDNQQRCGDAIGYDLVSNPELLANDLGVGFLAAGWYWNSRKLNAVADAGDMKRSTKKINGGYRGLSGRKKEYNRVMKFIRKSVQPEQPSLAKSRTVQGGVTAAIGGLGGVGGVATVFSQIQDGVNKVTQVSQDTAAAVSTVTDTVGSLQSQMHTVLGIAGLATVMVLGGVGYLLYARWDDRQRGFK